MRWPWSWGKCDKPTLPPVPTEEEGRAERSRAEKQLRDTAERWGEVHDVSQRLERARAEVGQDPFLEELARTMRSRRNHREA